MKVTTVEHPVLEHFLTVLRNERTPNREFRWALECATSIIGVYATAKLETTEMTIATPLAPMTCRSLTHAPVLIPVMRAGLGMLPAMQKLLPDADVCFIGTRKNEETLDVEPYMESLTEDLRNRPLILLDPMLASGKTAELACSIAASRAPSHITVVSLIGVREGIARLTGHALSETLSLFLGAVDPVLDERAFIIPGLGDAGDRQFGPW